MSSPTLSAAVHSLIVSDIADIANRTFIPAAVSEHIDRLSVQLLGIERLLTAIGHPSAVVVFHVIEGLHEVQRSSLLGRYNPQPALKMLLEALRMGPPAEPVNRTNTNR